MVDMKLSTKLAIWLQVELMWGMFLMKNGSLSKKIKREILTTNVWSAQSRWEYLRVTEKLIIASDQLIFWLTIFSKRFCLLPRDFVFSQEILPRDFVFSQEILSSPKRFFQEILSSPKSPKRFSQESQESQEILPRVPRDSPKSPKRFSQEILPRDFIISQEILSSPKRFSQEILSSPKRFPKRFCHLPRGFPRDYFMIDSAIKPDLISIWGFPRIFLVYSIKCSIYSSSFHMWLNTFCRGLW